MWNVHEDFYEKWKPIVEKSAEHCNRVVNATIRPNEVCQNYPRYITIYLACMHKMNFLYCPKKLKVDGCDRTVAYVKSPNRFCTLDMDESDEEIVSIEFWHTW
jgi:hypothetical protein